MLEFQCEWTRYWCPREGRLDLSDDGYLVDPSGRLGAILHPELSPTDNLPEKRCVILLGEAGIGKSTALSRAIPTIRESLAARDSILIWCNLAALTDTSELTLRVWESTEFKIWLQGKNDLHLYLDGFDELHNRVSNLPGWIVQELVSRIPAPAKNRTYLRLACRTGNWPESLGKDLRQLFSGDSVDELEMAPLRKLDVVQACEQCKVDSQAFLLAVAESRIEALANSPLSLQFLLQEFKRDGTFPARTTEIWERGCLRLCEETYTRRDNRSVKVETNERQRLWIAGLISALLLLANKQAIWTGKESEIDEDTQIGLKDIRLFAGRLPELAVTDRAITETIAATGLFTSRGVYQMGLARQQCGEFLAAWFLIQARLVGQQLWGIIAHRESTVSGIARPLSGVAVWLANLNQGIRLRLATSAPEVLIYADRSVLENDVKREVVNSLLRQSDADILFRASEFEYHLLRRLAHPELSDQLKAILESHESESESRILAVRFVGACKLPDLAENLLMIAVDESEWMKLRLQTVTGLVEFMSHPHMNRLRELLASDLIADTDDELRGTLIRSLWPSYLSSEELFNALKPPKAEGFIGLYALARSPRLLDHLEATDLPHALVWAQNQQSAHHLDFSTLELIGAVIRRAWANVRVPGIREALAVTLVVRLEKHDHDFGKHSLVAAEDAYDESQLFEDDFERRALVDSMLPHILARGLEPYHLVMSSPHLIGQQDFGWLCERLHRAEGSGERQVFSNWILGSCDYANPKQIDQILQAREWCTELAVLSARHFDPVPLDSDRARQEREYLRSAQQMQLVREKRKQLEGAWPEALNRLLQRIEADNIELWWQVPHALAVTDGDPTRDGILQVDIRAHTRWNQAGESLQARIITSAERYVLEGQSEPGQWLGKEIYFWPAIAGYKALRLLYGVKGHDYLKALGTNIWEQWAPIALGYPAYGRLDDDEEHQTIIAEAFLHAPNTSLSALDQVIEKENAAGGHIGVVRLLNKCKDPGIESLLMSKLRQRCLAPKGAASILEYLLQRNNSEARNWGSDIVSATHTGSEEERSLVSALAPVLVNNSPDADWGTIWPALEASVELGREVLGHIAIDFELNQNRFAQKLTDKQLGDLLHWLLSEFPTDSDLPTRGSYTVTVRHEIAGLRGAVVSELMRRSSSSSQHELQRVARSFPHERWLSWYIASMSKTRRDNEWSPIPPNVLLSLVRNHESRIINDGADLLDVVLESLQKISDELRRDGYMVRDRWDKSDASSRTPKPEKDLAAWIEREIRRHLKEGAVPVVVNREVEIGFLSRADLKIDASCKGDGGRNETVSVILEAKRCNNRELESAMESQLVAQYMIGRGCYHGVYFIGWFYSERWRPKSYRYRQAWPLEYVEACFEAQSTEVSTEIFKVRAFVLDATLPRLNVRLAEKKPTNVALESVNKVKPRR